MDEITLLRSLPSEGEAPDPAARAVALRELEGRFELSGAPSTPPVRTRRRGVFALAGAGATAAVAAAVLLFSSGPSADSAAAEVLRHTAAIAAVVDNPSASTPGPGQFLYTKTKRVELQGWIPGNYTIGGGLLSEDDAFNAVVPWQEEAWRSADEPSRNRWVMGDPRFLSEAERSRWERAGSPLPSPFEGKPVRDVEAMDSPGFRDFSALPIEPQALRLAIEARQGGETVDPVRVISELWDVLDKPNTTPELRAAVFGALAELPGIELDRDATDLVGRPGYALVHEGQAGSVYGEHQPGLRVEYIFDPKTSEILGRREVIADPAELDWAKGIPAGTVRREVAYMESGIVSSTRERPDPVNTIS